MAETDATNRGVGLKIAPGKGDGATLKCKVSTVELAAATSGDTIDFGRIPSNARISSLSRVYWDDLATTGTPELDIGLRAVEGNLANANDPDALSNGHALQTATTTGAQALAEIASSGLPAWDLVASETSDPGGVLEVYGSVTTAATTQTGTITLELFYYLD
jgi:hypothetical protein